eukprot:CFRG2065T1
MSTATWFYRLTGIVEETPEKVRKSLLLHKASVGGENTRITTQNRPILALKSNVNGKTWICGVLETPSLAQLRARVNNARASCPNRKAKPSGTILVTQICGDIKAIIEDKSGDYGAQDSVFQVASQFNLLEMAHPDAVPDDGVGIYEYDHTQGPTCAIASGAGTIYRNYFARTDENGVVLDDDGDNDMNSCADAQMGQTVNVQICCMSDLERAFQANSDDDLWDMKNGYLFATHTGLRSINLQLQAANEARIDKFREHLRIGLQWHTMVTTTGCKHIISQAYCSALPIAYSNESAQAWSLFAKLVLEASYEATLCAAELNYYETGNNKVFLTLIGGGVFGNRMEWIICALERSIELFKHIPLDVIIVSYGMPSPHVQRICTDKTKVKSSVSFQQYTNIQE